MIEKLPEYPKGANTQETYNDRLLWGKINELIDKVNTLERAVKQIDRPIELE